MCAIWRQIGRLDGVMRPLLAVLFIVVQTLDARAEPPSFEGHVGDLYEIRLESETKISGGRSSGSSNSRTTLVERVLGLHDGGIELEFDLPKASTAGDRTRAWQFPARIFKSSERSLQLLNGSELEARVAAWLKLGGLTPAACGQWVFTWTANKIECDPQSVLQMLEPFDLRLGELKDGAEYLDAGARTPGRLRQESRSLDGATFVAEMEVDQDVVRRERTGADVALASMTGAPPLAIETALKKRASEKISGTISTTLETNPAGHVMRRTRVTRVEIVDTAGVLHRQTTTARVERRQTAAMGSGD